MTWRNGPSAFMLECALSLAVGLATGWLACKLHRKFTRKRDRPGRRWVIYAVVAGYILLFGFMNVRGVQNFLSHTNMVWKDLLLNTQVFHNTLHGKWFMAQQLVQQRSYLATHFSLIFLLVLPLYALWPGPAALAGIGTVAMGLGALPLHRLARAKLGSELAAVTLAASYLLVPFQMYGTLLHFYQIELAAPLLLASFWSLETRRNRLFVLFAVPLALCREDLGLYIAAMGLYAMLAQRRRRFGLVVLLAGLLWVALVLGVFMPALGTPSGILEPLKRFARPVDASGPTPGKCPLSLENLAPVFSKARLKFLVAVFVPVALLPFFSPRLLLLALVPVLEHLASRYRPLYGPYEHYIIIVYPLVFAAAVSGARRIAWESHSLWGFRRILKPEGAPSRAVGIGVSLLTIAVVNCHFFAPAGYWPAGRDFRWQRFRTSERVKAAHAMMRLVEPGNPVHAPYKYQPHFAFTGDVVRPWEFFETSKPVGPHEYVFVDWSEFFSERLRQALQSGLFGVVAFDNKQGYILLRRGENPSRNGEVYLAMHTQLEAERLSHQTGRTVFDSEAGNGLVQEAIPGEDKAGYLVYGPFRRYPPGTYDVTFRLKLSGVESPLRLSVVDVTGKHGHLVLASRALEPADFKHPGDYEDFTISFTHEGAGLLLEFRVLFEGTATLSADSVTVSSPALTAKALYELNQD